MLEYETNVISHTIKSDFGKVHHRSICTGAFWSIGVRIHMIFFGATESYLLMLPSMLPRRCSSSTSVHRTFSYHLLEYSASLSNCIIELINKSLFFGCCLMREWAPTLSPIDQSSPNDFYLHKIFFALYVIWNMVKKIACNCAHEKGREVLTTFTACSLDRSRSRRK